MADDFTKFIRLSRYGKKLIIEALITQFLVGFLLLFIPFRKIPGMFPNPAPNTQLPIAIGTAPSARHPESSNMILEEIKYATKRVSRFVPWRNKCLVKALSARKMLTKRGIQSQLSLGVSKDSNSKTVAHAWLKSVDFEVVEKNGEYLELYLF